MKHDSGLRPIDYSLIVYPDEVEKKTKGGIILTDDTIERDQNATTRAEVVAVSPLAFNYEDYPEGFAPKVGDRVVFGRYKGYTIVGRDGKTYRVLNDRDVRCVEV